MATGIGERSPRRQPNDSPADENKPRMFAVAGKRTLRTSSTPAFAYPKYPWGPDQVFRYNSDAHVRARGGDGRVSQASGGTERAPVGYGGERGLRPIGVLPRADAAHDRGRRQPRNSDSRPTASIRPSTTSPSSPRCSRTAAATTVSQLLPAPRIAEALFASERHRRPAPRAYESIRRSALPPVVLVDSDTAPAPAASSRSRTCRATAATWSCCCRTASPRSGSRMR